MAADQAVLVVLSLAIIAAGWVFVGYPISRPHGILQHDKEFGLAVVVGLSFVAAIVSDVMYWLMLPDARGRYSREMDAFDQFVCAAPWAFVSPVFAYMAFRLSSQSFGKVATGLILALSLLVLSEVLIALVTDRMHPWRGKSLEFPFARRVLVGQRHFLSMDNW